MSKIIHSFWSRPMRAAGGPDRFAGGWRTPRHHLQSWVLSAMTARQSHGRIELVTDRAGERLLVDSLAIPYDNVQVTLDSADSEAPSELWAYGKLLAYEQQEEPFLHIDGDVYLWKKLPQKVLSHRMIAQSREAEPHTNYMHTVYVASRRSLVKSGVTLPASWSFPDTKAYNCGVMGGTDIDAIRRYVGEAKQFVRDCREYGWNRLGVSTASMNVMVEQLTMYTFAARHNIPVGLLFEDFDVAGSHENRSRELGYTHMMADKNASAGVLQRLSERVQRDYPEQFDRIERLLAPAKAIASSSTCKPCARKAARRLLAP